MVHTGVVVDEGNEVVVVDEPIECLADIICWLVDAAYHIGQGKRVAVGEEFREFYSLRDRLNRHW